MSLHDALTSMQSWRLAQIVRGDIDGSEWVFPIIETLHVLALALVFGSIAMVDLRLLGITQREISVSRLAEELLPITWIAWFTAALFGSLLFVSKAVTYAGNLQFQMKFVCMALAGVNMLVFQFGAYRAVARWDRDTPPRPARIAGALSLALWIGVIFFGRWTGFTT